MDNEKTPHVLIGPAKVDGKKRAVGETVLVTDDIAGQLAAGGAIATSTALLDTLADLKGKPPLRVPPKNSMTLEFTAQEELEVALSEIDELKKKRVEDCQTISDLTDEVAELEGDVARYLDELKDAKALADRPEAELAQSDNPADKSGGTREESKSAPDPAKKTTAKSPATSPDKK